MRLASVLLILLALAVTARAQCIPQWTSGGALPGVDGQVYCSTVWSHGGTSYLVVGGNNISVAGDAFVRNIAAFDGVSWHALGAGVAAAYLMTTYNGDLIVEGLMDPSGMPGVARWNGQTWAPLPGLEGSLRAMMVFNGELIVAGNELTLNGTPVPHLAAWNGLAWRPLGAQPQGLLDGALSLSIYNNELILGGHFSAIGSVAAANIGAWNGITWHALGAAVANTSNPNGAWVNVLAVYNNELIAGGTFLTAGTTAAVHIARWNGTSWQAMGPGLSQEPGTMAVHGTELFVGGGLGSIARWNGSQWLTAGGSLGGPTSQPANVNALSEFQGSMYVGGNITYSGNTPLNFIGRWDGTSWIPVGSGWSHGAGPMAVYNGEAIVQGYLSRPGDTPIRIGAWNGTSFRPLEGPNPPGFFAMTVYQGQLIGAGAVGSASGSSLWRWTGAFWQNFAPSLGDAIYALAVYNDQIIAGGAFPGPGESGPSRIARWDGAAWRDLGSGVQGGAVQALAVYGGDLVAGGNFDSAGGVPGTGRLARWNGTSWGAVGGGVSIDQVAALAVYNNDLIAAGVAPPDRPTTRIARWDGAAWHALGAAPGGSVFGFATFQGDLICGGSLDFGTNGTWTIARWNGRYWRDLGGGPGGHPDYQLAVYRMLPFGDELLVGGDFKVIPGSSPPGRVSANLAHWRCLGSECYANCDNSTVAPILNSNDFQCFLNTFAAAAPYANCDGSASAPLLNINDFQCFLNAFAVGCP